MRNVHIHRHTHTDSHPLSQIKASSWEGNFLPWILEEDLQGWEHWRPKGNGGLKE